MRMLALDVGEKNIGLAVSDSLLMFAQPCGVLRRTGWREELQQLQAIVEKEQVTTIVIGLAKNMDGSEGASADKCRMYGGKIAAANIVKEVVYYDERLTTSAAEKLLIAADVSRKKRKSVNDKIAAALILQNYLDLLRNKLAKNQKED